MSPPRRFNISISYRLNRRAVRRLASPTMSPQCAFDLEADDAGAFDCADEVDLVVLTAVSYTLAANRQVVRSSCSRRVW